ncbi:hypothetical protein C8C83_2128 [Flavobacterium sp. 90]|uniref:hypothetical protein n=1 Tax=unclassified Flavobacterium TaxID=196869 RepID=UPI000EAD6C70|nr:MULTISPECIES: hypothetical protein [unclassified Flavobacterium]RKR10452.1 hypothetical protein C8C82_2431 [Flavobacterium sp. 81]TCK54237.1 hypothetical protein C8C83_2128 [Flavobacterium sp. 90]
MKKAALTFGLFSLILVATSFVTPEKTNKSTAGNIDISVGVDGGQLGRIGRKSDFAYNTSNQVNAVGNKFKSFSSDSQVTKSKVKLD